MTKNLVASPPQGGRWQDGTLDPKLHSLIYISELQTQADVTIVKLYIFPLEDNIVGNNSIRNWGGVLQYSKLSVSNNAPLCYITLLCKVQIIDNSQRDVCFIITSDYTLLLIWTKTSLYLRALHPA